MKRTLTVVFLVLALLVLIFAPVLALASPKDMMDTRRIELTAYCQRAASTLQQTMREGCFKTKGRNCDRLNITLKSALLSQVQKPGNVGICVFENYIRLENPLLSALVFMYTPKGWDLVEDDFF